MASIHCLMIFFCPFVRARFSNLLHNSAPSRLPDSLYPASGFGRRYEIPALPDGYREAWKVSKVPWSNRKLCHSKFLPMALPVDVFWLTPHLGGISPLTCTIFDPIYFGTILRNQIFHISPTSLKKFIMGNYLDFALKIAHRGNTGSHKGKRKMFCMLG